MRLSYSINLNYNIEEKARKKGMVYPSELKVLEAEENKE